MKHKVYIYPEEKKRWAIDLSGVEFAEEFLTELPEDLIELYKISQKLNKLLDKEIAFYREKSMYGTDE